jgi:hypothetical protein
MTPPTVDQLKDLARENDLSGYSDMNKEQLEGLLRENNVEVPDDSGDGDAADQTQPGVDGVTPIPVDATNRPASPTAAAPTPSEQPGIGRTANVTDSALPKSTAERYARIREGKQSR